jgi:protein Tex
MEGVVTNVANFGAFVDIGVHQDGLVHVSEISDKFVEDAKTVLTVGDVVKVRVLGVDAGQKRISLSMKQEQVDGVAGAGRSPRNQHGRGGRHEGGIKPHATIADLKARLGGPNPNGGARKGNSQPNKLSSMIKKFKKGL